MGDDRTPKQQMLDLLEEIRLHCPDADGGVGRAKMFMSRYPGGLAAAMGDPEILAAFNRL